MNYFGEHFENVKLSTNGNFNGPKTVTVTYDTPTFNGASYCPSRTITKTITFEVSACKNSLFYSSHPGYHKSHTFVETVMDGNNIQMNPGSQYQYASAGNVTLLPSFTAAADNNTTLELLIDDCDCNSPYLDPNNLGGTQVSYTSSGKRLYSNEVDKSQNDGENKFNDLSEIEVYPNPFSNSFKISGLNDSITNDNMRLIDPIGRIIAISIFPGVSSETRIIQVPKNLSNGLYYLEIDTQDRRTIKLLSRKN